MRFETIKELAEIAGKLIKEGVVSQLMVPIRSGDEVIGMIGVFSGVKQEFP